LKFVSRRKVNLDRTASAWLLKRFVDKDGELVFYTQAVKPEQIKERHASDVIFDVSRVGAEFFMEDGDTETVFQKIVRKHGIQDPAVQRMALLLRGSNATETPSEVSRVLSMLVNGWKAVQSETDENDDYNEALERHFVIFDDLYQFIKAYPDREVK
jgi:hypothetical protein